MPFTKKSPKLALIWALLILITCLILPFSFCCAQTTSTGGGDYGLSETAGATQLPQDTIPVLLGRFAGAALALSGSIFLFLIIYGGIIIMTAAGAPDKVTKGKNIIIWAIIGALLLGGAYAITNLVFQSFTDTSSSSST